MVIDGSGEPTRSLRRVGERPADRRETADWSGILAAARRARWRFPSSSGRPIRPEDRGRRWYAEICRQRDRLDDAVGDLIANRQAAAAMELASRAWRIFLDVGDPRMGAVLLDRVLAVRQRPQTRDRIDCLYGRSLCAFWMGEYEIMRRHARRAAELGAALEDREGSSLGQTAMARAEFAAGRYRSAARHAIRARALAAGSAAAFGQAALHLQAQSMRMLGQYDAAAELFQQSITLNREVRDPGMLVVELGNLGHVEVHRGRPEAAARLFAEALRRDTTRDEYGRILSAVRSGSVAVLHGDLRRAQRSLRIAEGVYGAGAVALAPDDEHELRWLAAELARATAR